MLLPPQEILARLSHWAEHGAELAYDVEGQQWMTCCGWGWVEGSTTHAMTLDTLGLKGTPWSKPLWEATRAVLESPRVRKHCWNAMYERAFLQWVLGIRLRNYEDPMFRWAERWPELPKGLDYAASILTRIPCWTEGISFASTKEQATGERLWRYNATDCAATIQLALHPQLQLDVSEDPARAEEFKAILARLKGQSYRPTGLSRRALERYRFHLALIEPLNYASQKGILYDHEKAQALRSQIEPRAWEAQARVDELAGRPFPSGAALWGHILSCCGVLAVRAGKVATLAQAARHAKKDFKEGLTQLALALGESTPGTQLPETLTLPSDLRGALGSALKTGVNVKSSGKSSQVITALKALGLTIKAKRPEHEGDEARETADAAAVLETYIKLGEAHADPTTPRLRRCFEALTLNRAKERAKETGETVLAYLPVERARALCLAILAVRAKRGQLQELNRGVGADGRIRCMFLPGYGTETGRTTSSSWLDGSGGNLQTVPKEPVNFRTLYTPDPGYVWWKLDLTGADLWTVAARLATLGDRTMLEDLLAGIRIPSLIGLILEENYRPSSDRARVRADCIAYRAALKAKGESWKDHVWKITGHLTNYGGEAPKIRSTVIESTYAATGTPIDPGLALCQRGQSVVKGRYWGLPRWWSDTASRVVKTGSLTLATGQVREFLSRRPRNGKLDGETHRQVLAAEPQAVTTYIINQGQHRLWHDPENWTAGEVGESNPFVQLLLTVHDESAGQMPIPMKDFGVGKLEGWFHNPIRIGAIDVNIPYEGFTGASWGECYEPFYRP